MKTHNPLISIVTICLNEELTIEETIKSVSNQSLKDFEYVVWDGSSTDGTMEILQKNRSFIDILKISKDNGLYDAMNRAIELCSGEWVIFMNSGDRFSSSQTLENIFRHDVSLVDIIYGDTEYFDGFRSVLRRAKKLDFFWMGSRFSHQSALVRTDLLKLEPFDLNLSLAADFKMFYRMYHSGKRFKYIEEVVSICRTGGLSDRLRAEVYDQWASVSGSSMMKGLYFGALILSVKIKRKVVRSNE